ncbi:G1 family glutamic endopeptidase [Streptomyces sp. FXJ1.172]|uniref:G1 family glutamic endopeptidase n=1 Tax=Streptomyces sp. FXJ1.172 TaxID=710705 RepID=UPI0007CFD844|nr:G1 family glutamic endopeptidase [Streptomyces sp. FXJ1.172]WEO93443.1 G1 family endopeptidase [Streptomyces sp. FXJ1.172]
MGTNAGTRRNRFTGRAAAAGLLLAAAALVPAYAGSSAAAASTGFGPHAGGFQDSNWGGYVATGSFGTITGSWTEPHVTCTSRNDLFAPWIGLDGYGSQTVEQAGVQADCSSGSPVFSAWYEMYPAAPVYWNDPVSEGDSITASVVSNGGGSYTLTLTDNTRRWTEHADRNLGAYNASAEAVIESPTQSYPSFSKLDFSGVTVDGQPFDATHPQALASGGYAPGPLSGGFFSMTPSGVTRAPHAPAERPAVIRY